MDRDIAARRSREDLEERLATTTDLELAEILRAALAAGDDTEAWMRAESALGLS